MAYPVDRMPAVSDRASSVRAQMEAARSRIRRVKRVDRAAVAVITVGGIGVIVAVIGILLFIGAEALPLFRSGSLTRLATVPLTTGMAATNASALRALGMDEYRR